MAGVCFDVSRVFFCTTAVLCIDCGADKSTIKGIPRGGVSTRSHHTPGMWSRAGRAHSHRHGSRLHPSTAYLVHHV